MSGLGDLVGAAIVLDLAQELDRLHAQLNVYRSHHKQYEAPKPTASIRTEV